MPTRQHHLQTGYVILEVAIAFALLTAMAVSLMVMVHRHSAAAKVLDDRRQAVRLAEQVLLSMQSPHIAAPADADAMITMKRIAQDEPMPGWQWVEVHVECNRQIATLYGLVQAAVLDDRPGVMP